MEENKNISRKKFFKLCASVLAGGSIAAVSGILLHRNLTASENERLAGCPFPHELSCSGCRSRRSCPLIK